MTWFAATILCAAAALNLYVCWRMGAYRKTQEHLMLMIEQERDARRAVEIAELTPARDEWVEITNLSDSIRRFYNPARGVYRYESLVPEPE